MTDLPSGTVTFLFTDIEGSTQLWEKHAEAMQPALAEHDTILREAVESNRGHRIKTTGDGIHAVFEKAMDAICASVAAQQRLQSLVLPQSGDGSPDLRLKVRMGLHTGEAELRGGDYYGQALNRAARIMSAAYGGQILLSGITAEIIHDHLPENMTLFDLGEHRLKDLTRTERIFQLNATGLPKSFPPLKSIDTVPNNLPLQLTSFIGRGHELVQAKQKLEGARLLTLIGPGGTGKTRLSLQLASDLLSSFRDGVWLVELAPLANPALVLQSIASVFGIREQPGMSLDGLVMNYFRDKHLLLVLDNCEHLIETCAQLTDRFLHNSLYLRIIASSREALGIGGETVYRVPSLSLPGSPDFTLEELASFESVQLFVDRASATHPNFHLTDKNASAIAQICQRLDGIPLAIELAAARVAVFSAEHIAARLDDRFKLLTGGSRTALPRQQTLRALIDWSYDMLSEDERALFRRLSVFADGWSFEAAEALCPELDVLTLLTQLVNKSLVTVDDDAPERRYRLLETVRQYARDKLLESGEMEPTRNRHLEYFYDLSQTAEPYLTTASAMEWILRLEAEYSNIRAAMEWGMERNLQTVLEMCSALPDFWLRRGLEGENRVLIEQALARTHTLPKLEGRAALRQTNLIAKTWLVLAFLSFSQGDSTRAVFATRKCAQLARQTGDKSLLARALGFEYSSKMALGDPVDVDTILNEGLVAARESGEPFANGMLLGMVGTRMMMVGQDLETAQSYIEQGLALLKESDNRWGFTMILLSMAIALKYMHRFAEARSNLAICFPIFQEMGDRHRVNMVKSELAHMEREEGHYETAEQMYRGTIMEWQRLGHRAAVAHQLECLAFLARVQENGEHAATLFGAAEALREQIEISMTVVERVEYDREVADLRAGMDKSAFESAWTQGRAMTMDEAIGYALHGQI